MAKRTRTPVNLSETAARLSRHRELWRRQLTEAIAVPSRLTQRARPSTALVAGDQRTFGRHHVHRVTNLPMDPAVSLHVYAPKLTVMRTYVDRDGVLHLASEQREGVNW